ncbi:glucuronyl hydrolase [Puteibacter caeruleilacunae]|nr:glucuronyl hydrolase [Puteibacter caeruleilacunae]
MKRKVLVVLLLVASMGAAKAQCEKFCNKTLKNAEKQLSLQLKDAYENDRIPRTVNEENEIHWAKQRFDWTEGFFPGTCWYMYEFTGDAKWKKAGEYFENMFYEHRKLTTNHDLGFVFNCSYGNGYRLTDNEKMKEVMIEAAKSLSTRFNPNVGCIKSWDVTGGWQAKRGWKYPVIIDNMMNLELLFEVSKLTGDDKYKNIAITHANTTMKNHYRPDNSSFHVIDYDPETGKVRNRHTAQGYAHESRWARGQAWGLYGYTVCYRYTKDPKYLEMAKKIADFIMTSKEMPADRVPYWDYDVPEKAKAPRDASAAAITASALIELGDYAGKKYLDEGVKIVESLASKNYMAKIGTNHNFVLMHSVGSIPHGAEIDKPLNYADYYFVEALLRLRTK